MYTVSLGDKEDWASGVLCDKEVNETRFMLRGAETLAIKRD